VCEPSSPVLRDSPSGGLLLLGGVHRSEPSSSGGGEVLHKTLEPGSQSEAVAAARGQLPVADEVLLKRESRSDGDRVEVELALRWYA
jgi:hypothetical protein